MKSVIRVDKGIVGINLCFLTLYGILIVNNRLAVDDFHFLAVLKEHGVFGGVAFEYVDWSTRWPSVFMNQIFLWGQEQTGYGLLLHGVFSLGLFVAALYLLLKNLLYWVQGSGKKQGALDRSVSLPSWIDRGLRVGRRSSLLSHPNYLWNLALFLTAVLFMSTIRIDETWFWLCASCTYLWSVIMALFGMAWLLHPTRCPLFAVLGCLAFVYVGGSSGPLALFVLFLMASVILGVWLKRGAAALLLDEPLRRRFYTAFLCCFVGFIMLYMGEGNRAREAFFDDIGVGEALILNVKMTGIVLLKRVPQKLPWMIAASMPMVVVGGFTFGKLSRHVLIRNIVLGLTLYGFLVFVYQLPVTYKTQDVAAYRTLFPVTFLSLAFFAFFFFMVGAWLQPGEKVRRPLLAIPLGVLGVVFIFQVIYQTRVTSAYAKAYDRRMERIEEHRGRSSPLTLEPLPPSGMLYRAYIRKDTTHFSNQHMKKGLGLGFPLTLE